ncbi:patatin-like phospholipase family protein [Pseudomonas aeruginosa]|uniref:patatin-like phospholipase family protein n=1 Tax=Citrobacter freundii TaxID=546 RepID=UPI001BCF9B80|nr:patatin-like phospholipase family protein [Citrobacter freundii]MBN0652063.1 patatin-like phospholipase family protein [Pseudomonas aeruginosa]
MGNKLNFFRSFEKPCFCPLYVRILILAALATLSGCSSFRPWVNVAQKTEVQQEDDYRTGPVLVAVTLSGGGARAAAFGLGVLKELKRTEFTLDGRPTTLLDEVALVSGVSGGSILAAHYAAFGDQTLERFEPEFLLKPFESTLLKQVFYPNHLFDLTSPWFGRTHILAQRLDELYEGMTFGDVRKNSKAPSLMITATDLTTGAPFDFTPEQFALICSDLNSVPLSFAVASSSAVPIILSPMTLHNFSDRCGKALFPPDRSASGSPDFRIQMLQQSSEGYLDANARPYIHLVDGGVSDNLGIRLMIDRLMANGSVYNSFPGVPRHSIRRIVLVAVNSARDLATRVDLSDEVPSTGEVLETLLYGAGARETQMTLALLENDIKRMAAELDEARSREDSPFSADVEIHLINVSLRDLDEPDIRTSLLRVPTAFTIEAFDVRALQDAGSAALRSSNAFQRLKQSLDHLDKH